MQNYAQLKKSGISQSRVRNKEIQLEIPLTPAQDPPRAKKKKELTTFNIVMLMIFSAVVVVTYIHNVVSVDRLLMEITTFEKREADLKQQSERLRASINMLSSYTRIQDIALNQLKLIHNRQQPLSLNVYGITDSQEKN